MSTQEQDEKEYGGKLADPVFRSERARQAGLAAGARRNDPARYVEKLEELADAGQLTDDHYARLENLLATEIARRTVARVSEDPGLLWPDE
jgi:hypothetical protein